MRTLSVICFSTITISLLNCSKDPKASAASTGGNPQSGSDTAATLLGAALKQGAGTLGATQSLKIDKLGLQIDVPGEALVGDGIDAKSVMVTAPSVGGLSIGEANADTAKSLKAAKSEAELFKPRNVHGEQSADGYWLTFENTGSMGTNYWVKAVRQIGAKTYVCEGSPDTADKASAALAACKTLRQ